LARYVSSYVETPTYIHGFNVASVAAIQRSGDCTEYAVLTTALARSLGMPSKVMFGTVLIEEDDQVLAFGHAWTELWRDGRWLILDAALYGYEGKKLFYIPSDELEEEGPGYGMSILKSVGLMPAKIENLQNF